MRIFWSLLLCIGLVGSSHASDKDAPDDKSRASAYSAFSRGDSLTWDQLEVVAKDAGISGSRLTELKIRDRALRLIQHYQLPLEVGKFVSDLPADEEFRVNKGSRPATGSIEFNSEFWEHHPELAGNDAYLSYLLFRAQAYYGYRSRYDPEHCTWIVREESEPLSPAFTVLRSALNESASAAEIKAPPGERDLEFRRTLEPSLDPVRTLKKLVEFALRCIAEKASDNAALEDYRQQVGEPPLAVFSRMQERERTLASDFGRARFAMAPAERIVFHRILKTPFRYASSLTPKDPPSVPSGQ